VVGELQGAFGFGAVGEEASGLPAQRDVDRDELAPAVSKRKRRDDLSDRAASVVHV
jgi:hypothetical protein